MRHALILAGGSGQRLWPLSRQTRPKQLIPFLDGRCLLAAAAERLGDAVAPGNRYVCAAEQYREAIAAVLPGWSAENFIGEPVGRDTLMAIGLSAVVIALRDPEAIMAVFPADHLIQPVEEFRRTIGIAYALAERHPNILISFGITPATPSTAYGYLEIGAEFAGSGIPRVCRIGHPPGLPLSRETRCHDRRGIFSRGMRQVPLEQRYVRLAGEDAPGFDPALPAGNRRPPGPDRAGME